MKTQLAKKFWPAVATAALAWALPIASWAAPGDKPAKAVKSSANAPAASDTSDAPPGLDALMKQNEPKVIDELQADGLDALLDREFAVDNTPEAQRQGIKSLKALRQLSDPNLKLTPRQRLVLIGQAAAGLQAAKGSLPKNAARLEGYAAKLTEGATFYQDTLEFWGQSAVTQDQLRPIADTICDLYKMASDAAADECVAAAVANNLNKARDLDAESSYDKYLGNIFQYGRVLAIDGSTPAGKAERKAISDAAIDGLKQYDDPASGVQPVVELTMAKLKMLSGDSAGASTLFDNVARGKVQPAPNPYQLNDAHYFKAVALVIAQDAAGAKSAMVDLKTFQQTLPDLLKAAKAAPGQVADSMKAADTDNDLLQYRINILDADLAKDAKTKDAANQAASATLLALSKKRPDLQDLIDEQLVNCLPPNEAVATMDPLLLQAVMNKAASEYHKAPALRDKTAMGRGLEAAKEVVARRGKPGITPEFVLAAAKLAPALQEALGQNVDAINGYLDLVDQNKAAHPDVATAMLNNAGGLVNDVAATGASPPGFTTAYERFIKTAIEPPFNHKELCYAYARLLQGADHFKEAVAMYQRVPANDPSFADARWQLLVVYKQLDDTPTRDKAEHAATVTELASIADEIRKQYASATDKNDRLKGAYATMIAAELAADDQSDPKKAIDLLADFEKSVAGLNKQKELDAEVDFIRYRAYSALHQTDKINAVLVSIVNNAPGDSGIALVHDQLLELEKQYDKATAANDTDQMRQYSRMEAQLSGYLANWAKTNTDPVNRKAYYSYAVFDAKIKRIAGTLEDDPAAKQKDLKEALAQYDFLASTEKGEGHDLYVKQLDPKKVETDHIDPKAPDTYVEFGRALTQYELHDYKDAQATLGSLLVNKLLGGTSSDSYWEATVKLYDCNYQLAQLKDSDALKNLSQTKAGLKSLYIIGGIPPKWRSAFDALHDKMIPEWKIPDSDNTDQSASNK